ncbi:MAG: hypothetical protein JWM11_4903 [Planctomycetaceae bacterium]|nr:hypothetical protein [Planctomycetaceae bacterium]
MIAVVFLSLLVLTVVAGCVVMAMFSDVAFVGPHGRLQPASSSLESPPGTAVANYDGAGLALRIGHAVSRAVASLGMKTSATKTCDAACHQREIQVTIPEALAIVQELREQQPPAQIGAIRLQAQRNLSIHDGTHDCPLLMSGGFCACELARPVSCRTRCIAGADSPVEARKLAESMEMSVTETFRDCLQASGLDDSQYELNFALTQVLNTPHAGRRWAQGEHILNAATMNCDN